MPIFREIRAVVVLSPNQIVQMGNLAGCSADTAKPHIKEHDIFTKSLATFREVFKKERQLMTPVKRWLVIRAYTYLGKFTRR